MITLKQAIAQLEIDTGQKYSISYLKYLCQAKKVKAHKPSISLWTIDYKDLLKYILKNNINANLEDPVFIASRNRKPSLQRLF